MLMRRVFVMVMLCCCAAVLLCCCDGMMLLWCLGASERPVFVLLWRHHRLTVML
jgi:hypothetical protein